MFFLVCFLLAASRVLFLELRASLFPPLFSCLLFDRVFRPRVSSQTTRFPHLPGVLEGPFFLVGIPTFQGCFVPTQMWAALHFFLTSVFFCALFFFFQISVHFPDLVAGSHLLSWACLFPTLPPCCPLLEFVSGCFLFSPSGRADVFGQGLLVLLLADPQLRSVLSLGNRFVGPSFFSLCFFVTGLFH